MSAIRTLTSIAYSNTDTPEGSRRAWAIIPVPEGFKYVSSTVRKTTELGDFVISPVTFVRHVALTDRIVEVRVFVEAKNRLFARSWIGVELAVVVESR